MCITDFSSFRSFCEWLFSICLIDMDKFLFKLKIKLSFGHKSSQHIVNGDFEESLSPPFITILVNSLLSLIGTSFEYESTHSKWELKGVKEECKLFLFLCL